MITNAGGISMAISGDFVYNNSRDLVGTWMRFWIYVRMLGQKYVEKVIQPQRSQPLPEVLDQA
jgi:hypothetical protein